MNRTRLIQLPDSGSVSTSHPTADR